MWHENDRKAQADNDSYEAEKRRMSRGKTAAYSQPDNHTDRGDCRSRQLNNSYGLMAPVISISTVGLRESGVTVKPG